MENSLLFPTELSISELVIDITKHILVTSATSPAQPEMPGKKHQFQGKEAQIAPTYEPEMYTEINSNAHRCYCGSEELHSTLAEVTTRILGSLIGHVMLHILGLQVRPWSKPKFFKK